MGGRRALAGRRDGLALWASYSSADLSTDDLHVLSVYGSLDAGVASYTDPANLMKLGSAVTVDEKLTCTPEL